MSADQTIYIVIGAGASKPYKFPLGKELLESALARRNAPSPGTSDAKWILFQKELQKQINEFNINSLDEFVERRGRIYRDDPIDRAVSRFIAREILEAENRALEEHLLEQDTPLRLLINAVVSENGEMNLRKKKVAFLSFNFDRVLEKLIDLEMRLRNPQINCSNIKRAHRSVTHIHNHIQDLGIPKPDGIDFGEVSDSTIQGSARRLLHTHERMVNKLDFSGIRIPADASEIAFFGFGYHTLNLCKILQKSTIDQTVDQTALASSKIFLGFHEKSDPKIVSQFPTNSIVETCSYRFIERLING